MENQLKKNNTRDVWKSLKTISGFKAPLPQAERDLHNYYNRFNESPTTPPRQLPHTSSPGQCPAPPALHTLGSALSTIHSQPQGPTPTPPPSFHTCPGEKTAEEDECKEGSWTRRYQLQAPEILCGRTVWDHGGMSST